MLFDKYLASLTTAKESPPLNQGDSISSTLRRVFGLLNKREQKRSALLLLSIFVNSLVEILGLAVIVPVISLVVQPDAIEQSPYLSGAFHLTSALGIDTPKRFLILLCALLIAAFLFKAIFGLAVNLFQSRFSFAVAHRLSGQMWTHHFSKSLELMRSTNSGNLIAEINTWPIAFAQTFMVGGLMILSELTVVALIALGLLLYNPIVFVCIAVLLVSGSLLIRSATRKRLSAYSATRKLLEPQSNTLITNSVRGFLEVITFRATEAVKAAYLKDRKTIFRIQSNTSVLNMAPSKLYEVLAVVAVAGSIIIALLQGTPQAGFLQLLTFMAISAYRIMPSMSRLNAAILQMRSQAFLLQAMETGNELTTLYLEKNPASGTRLPEGIDIRLDNVTLEYESLENPVIQGLSCRFTKGQIQGIVGPSGSGKSTLISALLNLHKPSKGSIGIGSQEDGLLTLGQNLNIHDWIHHVGYLSQQPFLFQGSVRENLTLRVPHVTIDKDLVSELIDVLELRECLGRDPLEFQLHEGGSNLSGGQQQRLALLRAMQVIRPVLVLDEATSALDPRLRDVVFTLLRERADNGCNVIIVTHDIELAEKCDSIMNLALPFPTHKSEAQIRGTR